MTMHIKARNLRFVPALAALLFIGVVHAQQSVEPHDLLIRNATLLDPTGDTTDRMVSLLIRNGELEIITEDTIRGEDVDEVIDANAGFIIGNLEIWSRSRTSSSKSSEPVGWPTHRRPWRCRSAIATRASGTAGRRSTFLAFSLRAWCSIV